MIKGKIEWVPGRGQHGEISGRCKGPPYYDFLINGRAPSVWLYESHWTGLETKGKFASVPEAKRAAQKIATELANDWAF